MLQNHEEYVEKMRPITHGLRKEYPDNDLIKYMFGELSFPNEGGVTFLSIEIEDGFETNDILQDIGNTLEMGIGYPELYS